MYHLANPCYIIKQCLISNIIILTILEKFLQLYSEQSIFPYELYQFHKTKLSTVVWFYFISPICSTKVSKTFQVSESLKNFPVLKCKKKWLKCGFLLCASLYCASELSFFFFPGSPDPPLLHNSNFSFIWKCLHSPSTYLVP